jgi:phage terminase large subunit-like protein
MGLRQELINYSNNIINGKIVACRKHKYACMRFLRDLELEGTAEFPFVFIEEEGQAFLDWMRLFKHSKGTIANIFIEPHIIQKFIFGNIYGWYHKDSKIRRFSKLYWQVGRKNVKTQSLALVGSYELVEFEKFGSEIYCAATKRDQAKLVLDESDSMLKKSIFKDDIEKAYGRLIYKKHDSFMRALSEEDGKTGDGLNPQCGIIDEFHAHETTEIHDIIESGMLARKQPLIAIITTAGLNTSYPCYVIEYELVSKVLNPNLDFDLPYYFVMINELDSDEEGNLLDDIRDEKCWPKANPIAASYEIGRDFIRKRVKTALASPEKMTETLTKTFNVWVNAAPNTYMNMEKWKLCGKMLFPDIHNLDVYLGVDLSSRLDLTSVSFIVPLEDEYYAVLSHSFIPEDTFNEKKHIDKVPYDLWMQQGWITLSPGAEINYHMVLDYIEEQYNIHNWTKGNACFDRALANWLRQELDKRGFIPHDIPQSFTGLSEATKDFKAKVYSQKIYHKNDPVLAWAISNAKIHKGPSENLMLSKAKSRERIDPIVSLVTAHAKAMLSSQVMKEKSSIYESRGVLTL